LELRLRAGNRTAVRTAVPRGSVRFGSSFSEGRGSRFGSVPGSAVRGSVRFKFCTLRGTANNRILYYFIKYHTISYLYHVVS
jgi:hypothetical protein